MDYKPGNQVRVGDIVEFTTNFDYCNGPKKGYRYKVISTISNKNSTTIGVECPGCDYGEDYANGSRPNWCEGSWKIVETFTSKKTYTDFKWEI
jgi:hypothetical protein